MAGRTSEALKFYRRPYCHTHISCRHYKVEQYGTPIIILYIIEPKRKTRMVMKQLLIVFAEHVLAAAKIVIAKPMVFRIWLLPD
jgi:hypothetical protein